MRDLHAKNFAEGLATSTRFISPDGVFVADSEPDFAAQRIYHLLENFYEITDRYLAVPGEPKLLQWDSHLGDASSFEPGTYRPRVAVFTSSAEKCLSQPACAGGYPVKPTVPDELMEFIHRADEEALLESIGYIHFRNNNVGANVVAHEFGHVADAFLFPGFSQGTACLPGHDCVSKCVEDTSDEAPPLREAVAQMLALLYWYEASNLIDDQDCDAIEWISHNASYAETPGPCMAGLGQIAYMMRKADCPVSDIGFCDKPEVPGFTEICCDIGTDPDCVLMTTTCADAGGGSKSVPTGACSTTPGYRSNSTLEAFWQLLVGRTCAPDAPFKCDPILLPEDVSSSEAARALFYALRVNASTFRQLFDAVAAHYSCAYGGAAYDGVRAVLCNHKMMDCAAPPPLECGECGNAILEAGEQCDRTSIPVTCADLGYDRGDVSCSLTCELNDDGCALDRPTEAVPTDAASNGADASDNSGFGSDPGSTETDGCDCRHGDEPAPGPGTMFAICCLALSTPRRSKFMRISKHHDPALLPQVSINELTPWGSGGDAFGFTLFVLQPGHATIRYRGCAWGADDFEYTTTVGDDGVVTLEPIGGVHKFLPHGEIRRLYLEPGADCASLVVKEVGTDGEERELFSSSGGPLARGELCLEYCAEAEGAYGLISDCGTPVPWKCGE